jgi:hypothetical protein
MSSLKFCISDFNGVLTNLKERLAGHLASPRDADVWLVWQDIRGSYGDLIKTVQDLGIKKPTYVVQHGAMATRDYGPPNSMKLQAHKFLCWGKNDYDRLCSLGYKDKAHIVGCPLNVNIRPKVPHDEKVVLFVPVNTGKEEPENIVVYYELLKHKYQKAQTFVLSNRGKLKDTWGLEWKKGVTFKEMSTSFDVITKLLPWHEQKLYHGNVILGSQYDPSNNEKVFHLLQNVDAVVGLDEGTTEIFAYGHDIPVIVVDEFKYRQHKEDGRTFSTMDIHRSKGATHTTLDNLSNVLDFTLQHPNFLQSERAEVAEAELGLSYGDATANILKVIREDAKQNFNFLQP